MELTGKCKDDFLDYLKNTNQSSLEKGVLRMHWQEYPKKYLNTLIIEFFDSVGIYIEPRKYGSGWGFDLFGIVKLTHEVKLSKSRHEAQTEAIKIANQIYNEL